MNRLLTVLGAVAMIFVAISPTSAGGIHEPPASGYEGVLWDPDRSRGQLQLYGCASSKLTRALYEAGKDDPTAVAAKYEELRRQTSRHNPTCIYGAFGEIKVIEPAIELGSMRNPVGKVVIFIWALPVRVHAFEMDLWLMFIGAKVPKPIRSQAG